MKAHIEFMKKIPENKLPIIKLTKSKNGETGTATFIFIQPFIFELIPYCFTFINGIYLLWENERIESKDIKILFKDGNPFLIKTTFIFINSQEWFTFLNFMASYSKETGLLFTETNFSI